MSGPSPAIVPVFVDPTLTTVVPELDVRDKSLVTVQLTNLDGTQTFTGTVWTRQNPSMAWAPMACPDLDAVPSSPSAPLNTVSPDINVAGKGWLRVTGVMSGVGGTVQVCTRTGGPTK